jgi:hypothetical protein
MPGYVDEPGAPDDHEGRDQRHQKLDKNIKHYPVSIGQLVGEKRNVHMEIEAISRSSSDKSQHDRQKHRRWLGP